MRGGTLIPPHYVYNVPSAHELAVASVIWGISLGLTGFGVIRAGDQSQAHWRRTRKVTPYLVFIWLELVSSTVIGGIAWGFVRQFIPPSLWFFTGMIFLWIIQVHCILQIIITRIALLVPNKVLIRRLQWSVFAVCVLINIAVACIWIPARLQVSHRYVVINDYWDRTEKIMLAVIDAGLNAYFVYLVRSSLISYGLTRYVRLYRFNLLCICISMLMDVLIISMMSLSNTFLYVCFHPLAYLVKLHIEMTMANLIAKIVKASSLSASCYCSCHGSRADAFSHFQTQQQGRRPNNKLSPTAGRFKDSWLLTKLRRGDGGRMVPATEETEERAHSRRMARTEEYRRPSRKSAWCSAGSITRRSDSGQGSLDLESGQPSTSDTSTIVPPPAAVEGHQPPCEHNMHCSQHME